MNLIVGSLGLSALVMLIVRLNVWDRQRRAQMSEADKRIEDGRDWSVW